MLKFTDEDFKHLIGLGIDEVVITADLVESNRRISIAKTAQAKFDEWLAKQPRIYSTTANNTLWMKWSNGNKPAGYEASGYLIVEEK